MGKFIPTTKVSVTTDQYEKYDATLKLMYDLGWIERPKEETNFTRKYVRRRN